MSPPAPLTAREFLEMSRLPEGSQLAEGELRRLFWILRGQRKEAERQESFWAATNGSLAAAYGELERRTAELKQAREELTRLNLSLERRVAEQVEETLRRAREVDELNVQLKAKVRERSRELGEALKRMGEGRGAKAPARGDVLGERVRIERLIGKGGMGTVYLGEDLLTSRPVAVKLMHPDVAADSVVLQRFISEAAAVASITHPGVIRTVHIDVTEEGRLFQVMEYIDGASLASRCERGALGVAAALRVGAAIAEALSAAHRVGVIHRDVKPSNVLLCARSPGVRVLDFGISKITGPNPASALTSARQVMGTPQYMSPEQILDAGAVGPETDVYSLGVVLYEMITGRLPFVATSAQGYWAAHLGLAAPDARWTAPETPARLAELVARCLDKQGPLRPSAAEVARDLTEMADALRAPGAESLIEGNTQAPRGPDAETITTPATDAPGSIAASGKASAARAQGAGDRAEEAGPRLHRRAS